MNSYNYIQQYTYNGYWNVEGWVEQPLLETFTHLDESINQDGGVAEIGVHHGRFYLLLNAMVYDSMSYAIDIFDDQHLNVDGSGNGSLSAFKNNLSNYDRHRGNNTNIIQGDSLDSKLNLVETIGKSTMKYFSIDGGHNPQHVVNDLKIAEQTIRNEGVVIVDDILHPCWMGVLEGTLEYLRSYPTLVPFSIGCNKLFLCKMSYHPYYINHMKKYGGHNKQYGRKFFGHDIVPIHI